MDNLYSGSLGNLPGAGRGLGFARVDVSSYARVWEAVRGLGECGWVGFLHLAAMVNLVEVRRRPLRALRVNVGGTLALLEAARRLDAGRFVIASSVAVYGEPQYLPVDEEHPRRPSNLYGLTKLMGEQLVEEYVRDHGLSAAWLRYFNVYGPRMRPGPYAGVVLKFIKALLQGRPPTIHGSGAQTRDFVYVEDVAEANLRALETGARGAFNIGTGRSVSIRELYQALCRALTSRGPCPPPRHAPPRPGDIMHSRANAKRARELLGWIPQTPLEEGLRKTLEYYRSRLE